MSNPYLPKLFELAKDNPIVYRVMTMYTIGEYKNLEAAMYDMVVVLTNDNERLNQSLVHALSLMKTQEYQQYLQKKHGDQ